MTVKIASYLPHYGLSDQFKNQTPFQYWNRLKAPWALNTAELVGFDTMGMLSGTWKNLGYKPQYCFVSQQLCLSLLHHGGDGNFVPHFSTIQCNSLLIACPLVSGSSILITHSFFLLRTVSKHDLILCISSASPTNETTTSQLTVNSQERECI